MQVKALNLDYVMTLTADDMEAVEDYGVIVNEQHSGALSKLLNREVKTLYIMENDCCYPILMVEWQWYCNEDDQFILLPVECTDFELQLFRELEIY